MRNPRLVVPAALAALFAGFTLTGCGEDEVTVDRFSPDIVAVTAPDTLAAGEPLDVKIHWRALTTCQELSGFEFVVFDDTTYQIVAQGKETINADDTCDPIVDVREASYRIPSPPTGRFRIQVYGLQLYELSVVGGVTPGSEERHRVEVMTPGGGSVGPAPVAGATAKVVTLDTADTLLVLTTGADGAADSSLACAGASRAYKLLVTGSAGRTLTLPFQQKPARCGVPERTRTLF
jgi:hypothetical protein